MKKSVILIFLSTILLGISVSKLDAQTRQFYFLGHYNSNPSFNTINQGNFNFLGTFPGLKVLNSSNLTNPYYVNSASLPFAALGMHYENNFLYVGGGMMPFFAVVDLTVPGVLNVVGVSNDITGTNYQIVKSGNYCFLTSTTDTLYVFDVSVPFNPVVVHRSKTGSFPAGLALKGSTLYIGCSDGLSVYDVSNPVSPVLVNTVSGSYSQLKLSQSGNQMYANHSSGASLFDVSNASNPSMLGNFLSTFSGPVINPLGISSDRLFRVVGQVEAFDITTLNSGPVASYVIPAQINGVDVQDSIIFVSSLDGLTILKYGFVDPLSISESINDEILQVYPNPVKDDFSVTVSSMPGWNLFVIYNSAGKVVHSEVCDSIENERVFSLKNIANGNYFFRLSSLKNNKYYSGKFTKL